MDDYITICGRTLAKRCKCTSKRSGQRCRNPAMKNGCCALHGGKSSGPSPEGRAKIAKVHTVHGRETKEKRLDTSNKQGEMRALEDLMFALNMFPPGTEHRRGRKPHGMTLTGKAFELFTEQTKQQKREIIQSLRNELNMSSLHEPTEKN